MTMVLDPQIHMWMSAALVTVALWLYARERIPIETTSILIVVFLLAWGNFFPLTEGNGNNKLGFDKVLAGFSNHYLFAIMSLLVVAQGLVQTSALSPAINFFCRVIPQNLIWPAIYLLMLLLMVLSAFLNNTPLVVMAIPVLQAIAQKFGVPAFRTMMMVSFISILGGMTTVLGSSTNMLVSNALEGMAYKPFDIFDFIVPGSIMAAVGAVYVFAVMPFLFRAEEAGPEHTQGDIYKEFIVDLPVRSGGLFDESEIVERKLEKEREATLHFLQRGRVLFSNQFDRWRVRAEDILTLSAPRDKLVEILTRVGVLDVKGGLQAVAEVMVPPGSRLIEVPVTDADMMAHGCHIVAVQRHQHHLRGPLSSARISVGDVLLVTGTQDVIKNLVNIRDIVPIADSKTDVPYTQKAKLASIIFALTIAAAAFRLLPVSLAAPMGAVLMLVTGCLNVRQMMRALDRRVYFIIGASLALGTAISATGAAYKLGQFITGLPLFDTPFALASALFLTVAILTNILSNNATAVIFTPIALTLATAVKADPYVFALAVLFGANCSFASPIGYQTNLLVMGPGNYRFNDFMKAGIPLVLIMWITYSIMARLYFGL